MRILLLILQFPPDVNPTGILMSDLAGGLQASGHHVSVITTFPHYGKFRVEPSDRGKLYERQTENGLDVLRLYVFANGKKQSMIYRLLSYLSFSVLASFATFLAHQSYDVILAPNGGFFTGVAAYLGGQPKGIPFIYNVQDLYPETPVAAGQLTNRWAIRGLEKIERLMYGKAAHITVVTPSFRQNLVGKHVPPHKVSVIPNFVDTDFIQPLAKANRFSQQHGLENKFVVTHAGNLGYVYDLDTLLDAAALLIREKDIVFLIVGEGVTRPHLEARARELKLDNVRFMDYQPRHTLPYLRAASDLQVSLYRRRAAQYSMPSKMYEIMASGRPLLASADRDSDVWNLVAETGCGICVEPQSKEALAEAIVQLYHDPARCAAMGQRGRQAAERHYSKSVIVAQYESLMRRVVAQRVRQEQVLVNSS